MALPGDLATCTVTGSFCDPAGKPLRGTVRFTPNVILSDPGDSVVIPQVTTVAELSGGSFSITLLGTDASQIVPQGWAYDIRVELQNTDPYCFTAYLPAADSPLDISELTPLQPVTQMGAYLLTSGGTMLGPLYAAEDPTAPLQVATMGWVESLTAGLSAKDAVRLATAAALPANTATTLTLTANMTGALTVDGTSPDLNDRVLVKNEGASSAAQDNGIYSLTSLGTSMEPWVLSRTSDMNTDAQVPGAYTFVEDGSANAGFGFIVSGTGPYTLGTTAISWEQFTSTGDFTAGTGLTLSGQTVSLNVPVSVADGGSGSITAAASTAYAAKMSAAETVIYVSRAAAASDSNDGLSWGSAKATIAGALTALGTTGSGASLQNNTGLIQLGAGTWTDTATHTIQGCLGMIIQGMGRNLTFVEGPDAAAWIQLTGCVDFKLKDLSYTGSASGTGWGLESVNSWTGTQWTGTLDATRNGAENVVFGRANGTSASCAYGVKFTIPGASSDANNDEGYFRNCMFWNCATAVYVGHSESVQHTFDSCRFWSCGAGVQFHGGSAAFISPVIVGLIAGGSGYFIDCQAAYGSWESGVADYWHAITVTGGQAETAMNWLNSASGAISGAGGRTLAVEFSGGDWDAGGGLSGSRVYTYVNWQSSAASILTFGGCKLGSTFSDLQNITVASAATALVLSGCFLDLVPVINWAGTLRGLDTCTITGTPPVLNGGVLTGSTFSPLNFGAAGNGTTDDTTALQACAAVATSVAGVIDLGTHTFLTSSAISITTGFHMKGAGYNGGAITNSTSDIFTIASSASEVTFDGCAFTSASGGGHIWNASNGPLMSFWKILGCWLVQDNAAKGIWYQVGGAWIDCLVDQQCLMECSGSATLSPWSVLQTPGDCNSVQFKRMRVLANGATVPFFTVDPGYGAHTDTNVGFTASSPTVTDASAVSADLGLFIYSTNLPGGAATITAVTPGTGYTINENATATLSGQTCLVGSRGWVEEISFDSVTFEICTGGGIAMTGAIDVEISNCSNWDIPGPRTDTGLCSTNTATPATVGDTAAVTGDLGKSITGPGIPPGARITAVTASTGYTISANVTATASGVTFIVGGMGANFYSFTKSLTGYNCSDIRIRGGRAEPSASGFSDVYADSFTLGVLVDSLGSWGTPPVITSPAQQTTLINMVTSGGAPPALTAPALTVAGLTGATAPTRWVGATTGGAPSSGTFATGDFVTDTVNGTFWVCTAGGTHGTWATPVAGVPWEVQPSDIGIVAWTANPAKNPAVGKPAAGFAGVLLMWLFRVPAAGTMNKINYSLDIAGATMADAFLGIYSAGSSATLLASCATDQSTNMTGSAGAYAATLSSPLAVTAGLYRVGLVIGSATTMPTLIAAGGANSASFTNMGITSPANFMSISTGTGNTSLPAGPISSGSFGGANTGLPVFVMN